MNEELKKEFMNTQVNKLAFMGSGGDEYKEKLWNWIDSKLTQAKEQSKQEEQERILKLLPRHAPAFDSEWDEIKNLLTPKEEQP